MFPVIPTYNAPPSRPITKPIPLNDGTCIVVYSEFKELYMNNKDLRKKLWKCTKVAVKINQKYNPKEVK